MPLLAVLLFAGCSDSGTRNTMELSSIGGALAIDAAAGQAGSPGTVLLDETTAGQSGAGSPSKMFGSAGSAGAVLEAWATAGSSGAPDSTPADWTATPWAAGAPCEPLGDAMATLASCGWMTRCAASGRCERACYRATDCDCVVSAPAPYCCEPWMDRSVDCPGL